MTSSSLGGMSETHVGILHSTSGQGLLRAGFLPGAGSQALGRHPGLDAFQDNVEGRPRKEPSVKQERRNLKKRHHQRGWKGMERKRPRRGGCHGARGEGSGGRASQVTAATEVRLDEASMVHWIWY